MPKAGLSKNRIIHTTKSFENDDHDWAEQAIERWNNDLQYI